MSEDGAASGERTGAAACLVTGSLADDAPTGVGRYARQLIAAMSDLAGESGWRIEVATGPERARADLPADIAVRRLPGPRKVLQAALAAGLPHRWDRRLGRPRLVHQLNAWVPVPTRAPQVLTVHDLMPILHPDWFGRRHRWRFESSLRTAVARDAALVCVSAHVARLVETRLGVAPERLRVVHSGVSEEFRRPVAGAAVEAVCERYDLDRGRYLLALGVMSGREDPAELVRALPLVTADLGHGALVLTGPDRPEASPVPDVARAAGVGDRVRYPGFVPEEDLVPLLAGAAALVHPSRDEGFGFTPLEAMAAGTPAIASDAGSLPEVVGDAGLLVAPGDVDGWAEAIDAVVDGAGLRARLVERGRRHQARFTWDRTAREVLDVYDEVVGS